MELNSALSERSSTEEKSCLEGFHITSVLSCILEVMFAACYKENRIQKTKYRHCLKMHWFLREVYLTILEYTKAT
jgi:hypothetical protein